MGNYFDQFDNVDEVEPSANYFDQFDNVEIEAEPENDSWAVTKGLKAGVDQVQALAGGVVALAGDKLGSDSMKDYGMDVYTRNMEEAGENSLDYGFTDIDGVGKAAEWAGWTLGNLAPTMATALAGGGLGGVAAKQISKTAVKKFIAAEVAKGVSKKAAEKTAGVMLAKQIGQGTGAFLASAGMETGSIYGETGDADVALAHGAVAGAVDALPVFRILNKFGIGKEAADQVKKNILKEAFKQGAFEGSTEALQTLIEQHASYWVKNNGESLLNNLGEANYKEIVDAAAAGFLGGKVMGAGSQALVNQGLSSQIETPENLEGLTNKNPIEDLPQEGQAEQNPQPATQEQSLALPKPPIYIPPADDSQIAGNENNGLDGSFPYTPIDFDLAEQEVSEVSTAQDEQSALEAEVKELEKIVEADTKIRQENFAAQKQELINQRYPEEQEIESPVSFDEPIIEPKAVSEVPAPKPVAAKQPKKIAAPKKQAVMPEVKNLPPIIKQTKKLYMEKMAKQAGIKKGSPGYDTAISKLEDTYEDQVDRAYAELPFEDYNTLNPESPKSVNRMAYDNLREEFKLGEVAEPEVKQDSIALEGDSLSLTDNGKALFGEPVVESNSQSEAPQKRAKTEELKPLTAKKAKEQSLIREESEIDEYNSLVKELGRDRHGSNIIALRNAKAMLEPENKSDISKMAKTEIEKEIAGFSEIIESKKAEAEKYSGKLGNDAFQGSDLDYLSSEEKSRLHDLKQALPTTGQEALEAKERIRERLKARKAGLKEPKPAKPINVSNYYETEGARDLAHKVKSGDKEAITKMAKEIAEKIPEDDAVLVPMPSHTGEATATLEIANIIAKEKGLKVSNILRGAKRKKWYDAKKEGKAGFDFGFKLSGPVPENAYIIDAVYDTGETMRQAISVLPNAKPIVHSVVGGESRTNLPFAAEADKGLPIHEDGIKYSKTQTKERSSERDSDDIQVREPEESKLSLSASGDLFTPSEIPAKNAKDQSADTFNIRYEQKETGTFGAGLGVVSSPSDAAHVVAQARKHGSETFLVLITDKNKKPIHIIRHAKGTRDGSSVYPEEVVGAIAATEGAANVWFAHNHPSGVISASRADTMITEKLISSMDGMSINYKGHVIVGAGNTKATFLDPDNSRREVLITPARRDKKIALVEKVLKRRDPSSMTEISGSKSAVKAVNKIESENAILLLDTQHSLVGVLNFSGEEMLTLRKGGRVDRILKAIHDTNTNAIIIKAQHDDHAENVSRFINNVGGINILDAMILGEDGSYSSDAEAGGSTTSSEGEFFKKSSGDEPISLSVDAKTKGMTVKGAKLVTDSFLRKYKGAANDGLKVQIVNSQHELFDGKYSSSKYGRVKGVYQPRENTVYLVASNLDGPKDTRHTLQHEILVHKGLGFLPLEARKKLIQTIAENAPKSKSLKDTWEKIQRNYKGDSDYRKAEELMASLAERNLSTFDRYLNKIIQAIKDAFVSVGWIKSDLTKQQLIEEIYRFADAFEEGKRAGLRAPLEARMSKSFDSTEENKQAKEKGLDMSKAARMVRAKAMGFDTETVYYHGTSRNADKGLEYFKSSKWKDVAGYFTEDPEFASISSESGDKPTVYPVYINKGNVLDLSSLGDSEGITHQQIMEKLKELGVKFDEKTILSTPQHKDTGGQPVWSYLAKNDLIKDIKDSGFEGVSFREEGAYDLQKLLDTGERSARSTPVFIALKSENIRSVNAAFDPDYADSPNLMFSKEKQESFDNWVMPNASLGIISDGLRTKEGIKQRLMATRRKLQDRHIAWREVQEAIEKKGGSITDFTDAYNKFTLVQGKVGDKFKKLADQHVKPLVNGLLAKDIGVDELGDYLMAKFAPQRNARIAEINPEMPDGGSGLTDAEAAKILSRFDKNKTTDLESAAQKVYAMQKVKLDYLVDSGRITKDLREELLKDDRYVPLKGFVDSSDLVTDTAATGRGFDQAQAVFKTAKGRKTLAAEILSTSIRDIEAGIISSEKNRVGQSVLKMVMDNPNKNLWEVNPIKTQKAMNSRTGQIETRTIKDYKSLARDPNVFITWVEGKPFAIEFKDNPNGESSLARAVKNMGVDNIPSYAVGLAKLNRWLSYVNTALSPEFILTNPIRDVQTALTKTYGDYDAGTAKQVSVNLKRAFRATMNGMADSKLAKKLSSGVSEKESAFFQEYLEEGGKTDYFRTKTVNEMRSELDFELAAASKGKKGAAIRAYQSLFNAIENGNGVLENATRFSLFMTLREKGVSKHQAAKAAKNLTVNFNRNGESGALINSMYLFYNASIQGSHLTLKLLKNRKVQKLMVAAGAGMVALTQYNVLAGGDDDDGESNYFKIPDYEKERNLIFMWPDGSGRYTKIPLPYGLNVPLNAGAMIGHVINGADPLEQAAWLTSSAFNSFSPVSESGWNFIAPTVLDPFIDIQKNENFFGSNIMPEDNPFQKVPTPDSHKSFYSTNPAYKWVAENTNKITGGNESKSGYIDISPESIEHVFETYTGAAGGFANRVVTWATDPEMENSRKPFVRKFFGEKSPYAPSSGYREHTAHIYYLKERNNDLKIRALSSEKDKEAYSEFKKENLQGVILTKKLDASEKQIRKLRKIRKVMRSKGNQLGEDKIDAKILEIQERFNKDYNKAYLDKGIAGEFSFLKKSEQ